MWKKNNPEQRTADSGQSFSLGRDTGGLMGVPQEQKPAQTGSSRHLQPPSLTDRATAPAILPTPAPGPKDQAAGSGLSSRSVTTPPFPQRGSEVVSWRPPTEFRAQGSAYFALLLKTFLLSIFTLGVYSFWGKTEQRAYLWKRTFILGDPLEYTGTGKELFISFLIALPFVLVFSFLIGAFAQAQLLLGQLLMVVLLVFLLHIASYGALRYRLTRTRWHGIRGNLSGSALLYAVKAMGYTLVAICSLGLASPWVAARLLRLKLNNVWFGDRPFVFHGPARELYISFLLLIVGGLLLTAGVAALGVLSLKVLGVPLSADMLRSPEHRPALLIIGGICYLTFLLGLVLLSSFYHASFICWLARHLAFGEMRMRSRLTGGQTLWTRLTNMPLVVFTFGIGYAWAFVREMKMHLHSLDYAGEPRLESLLQDTKPAPARGEGLLDALDVDMAL